MALYNSLIPLYACSKFPGLLVFLFSVWKKGDFGLGAIILVIL